MIEKLELPSSTRLVCGKDYDLAFKYIKQTVNQLVDAVNGILDYAPLEMAMKAEPEYKNRNVKQAEKWMYCLCRFWNDGCDSYYGELVNIDTKVSSDAPFERDTGDWYQCCEPVKPDDDIIYKQITAEQKD